VLDTPRMVMAVPTSLPVVIKRRSRCHPTLVLRRDMGPVASKLTCSLRCARRPTRHTELLTIPTIAGFLGAARQATA
jgi:hypothetical protein